MVEIKPLPGKLPQTRDVGRIQNSMQLRRTGQNEGDCRRCPRTHARQCHHALEDWQTAVISVFNDDYGASATGAFMPEKNVHQVVQGIELGIDQFNGQLLEARAEKRLGTVSRCGNPYGVQVVAHRTIGRDTHDQFVTGRSRTRDYAEGQMSPQAAAHVFAAGHDRGGVERVPDSPQAGVRLGKRTEGSLPD